MEQLQPILSAFCILVVIASSSCRWLGVVPDSLRSPTHWCISFQACSWL